MPDATVNVARFPETATGVRATIDALLVALMNLEKAQGDLGRERDQKLAEKIDAFAGAASKAITPAEALKQRTDLDGVKKAFADQADAIRFWTAEAGSRLDHLSAHYWTEVADAIDARIAALRLHESKEQGDVAQVHSVIARLEARRNDLQTRLRKRQAAAKKGKK